MTTSGPDYSAYKKNLSAAYDVAAKRYRSDDEIEIRSANHCRLCGNLRRICASFGREIDVLDAGCGTGRHFHCLRNVNRLVGLDLSAEMLRAAETPVKQSEVVARSVHLVRGSLYEHCFPEDSFHVIYSLGVFGHGAQITTDLCAKFQRWLRPGGRLYFNALESAVDPVPLRVKKRIRKALYAIAPRSMQRRLDAREARFPVLRMTHDELVSIMRSGEFSDFTVSMNVSRTPPWRGVHLECIARK